MTGLFIVCFINFRFR